MPGKILCVAEKPSIAKAVAGHLSGGAIRFVRFIQRIKPGFLVLILAQENTGNPYIKNYIFNFNFGQPWGECNVVMTAVSGHLTSVGFGPECKDWHHPPPERLFSAPVYVKVDDVGFADVLEH